MCSKGFPLMVFVTIEHGSRLLAQHTRVAPGAIPRDPAGTPKLYFDSAPCSTGSNDQDRATRSPDMPAMEALTSPP